MLTGHHLLTCNDLGGNEPFLEDEERREDASVCEAANTLKQMQKHHHHHDSDAAVPIHDTCRSARHSEALDAAANASCTRPHACNAHAVCHGVTSDAKLLRSGCRQMLSIVLMNLMRQRLSCYD